MPAQGRLGDMAACPADTHGCPACSHVVQGPAVSGSSDVMVNYLPALRKGDAGTHAACCGPNTWKADGGASHVIINNQPAYRVGDPSRHCGGKGQLIAGSPDVIVGDDGGSLTPGKTWVTVLVTDDRGVPLRDFGFRLKGSGHQSEGNFKDSSWASAHELDEGLVDFTFETSTESGSYSTPGSSPEEN